MDDARRAVEAVARDSYGRLVAYLSSHTRDVAAAEDALGDALLAALDTWPREGAPRAPEAWLLKAARNRFLDWKRHDRVKTASVDTIRLVAESRAGEPADRQFPDERLKLLFVCAHPAIDPAVHTPLMLQTVLGITAARMASAFLVPAATMSQRLVRAKTKILDAGIPFEVPDDRDLAPRLDAVLEAIYAAFGLGWDDGGGELAEEAIWLGRVLVEKRRNDPEARGLLALMLHGHARRAARRSPDGRYVPLSEQYPALWSRETIAEAEAELAAASSQRRPGRFQLEAAIQSAHAARARGGSVDWRAIALFYDHLVRLSPTVGARVGRAAALAEVEGPVAALARLDEIGDVSASQPYWAVRAHLLAQAGRAAEARLAYDQAIALATDPAVKRFLSDRRG